MAALRFGRDPQDDLLLVPDERAILPRHLDERVGKGHGFGVKDVDERLARVEVWIDFDTVDPVLDVGRVGGLHLRDLHRFAGFGVVAVQLAAQFGDPDVAALIDGDVVGPDVV